MMTFHRFKDLCLVIGFLAQTEAIGDMPENKDVYYAGGFADDVSSCSDFENNFMNCKLTVATSDKDSSILVLKGVIDLDADITSLHMVSVSVCKITVAGCELMYTAVGEVCDTLTDKTAPWYPLLAAFNAEECDILKGSYTVDNMEVTLDYAQDVMTHQFVGEYGVTISITVKEEKLACYEMIVSIEEKHN